MASFGQGIITNARLEASLKNALTGTAGENIAAYQSVCIGDGSTNRMLFQIQDASAASVFGKVNTYREVAQSIAGADTAGTAIAVRINICKQGNPADNVLLQIRSGSQTGTLLATGTIAASSITTSATFYTLTLDTPVTFSAGTTYFFVYTRSSTLSDINYYVAGGNNTSVYANGTESANDGGVWGNLAADLSVGTVSLIYAASTLYKATTISAGEAAIVVGVATSAIGNGNSGSVQVFGVVTNPSWNWTSGKLVYATDDAGTISHTAGTVSRVVGRALSPTQMIVNTVS